MTAGRRAMLLMALFGVVWAAVEALASGVLRRYSWYQVVFTRYVVHVGLMLAVWGWRDPGALWRTRRPGYQIGRSLLMLAMPASALLATQLGLPLRTTMAVFWIAPLLVLAWAVLLLGERPSLLVWAATAVAYLGALVLVRPGPLPPSPLRLLLPLAMAASFSLYVVMTRSLRSETPRANLFYTALGVAVALAPFIARVWTTPTARDLAIMGGIGVLGFVGLYTLDRLAAAAPVSVSAPFVYLQLPGFLALEWGLGGERPGLRAAAGGAVIAVAALYLFFSREPGLMIQEPA